MIADGGDSDYNSAVFLQENSLVQGTVEVQTQTVNSDNIALEGCIPASFTFSFDDISNQDRIIDFIVGGTAVNGVDYQFIDSSMTIVAGDTSATIYIDAFSDGLTEGQESIWIIYQPEACSALDTAFLYINDAQPIEFTLDEFNLNCFDDNSGEIQVNATGGFPPYTYHVTDPLGVQSQTQANPITGLEAGTYTVQVFDSYGCQAEALVVGGIFDADTTFLPDGSGVTYDAPLDISGFNPGQTITDVSQIQQICVTMEHSYLGDLDIVVESPTGQTLILKAYNSGGGSCDLGEPYASGPVDGQNSNLTNPGVGYEYCFNATPVYGTMVSEVGNFTHTIPASTGGTYTDSYLPAGSYNSEGSFANLVGSDMNGTWTIHVTDNLSLDNGYIFNWYISLIGDLPDTLVTLTQPDEIITTGFVTNATCGGNDGAINIDIQNAVQPYTVQWSSGQTTEDISGLSAGTYTVTVTDGNGCQSVQTFLVNNIGSLSVTGTTSATSCYGGSDGAVNITAAGGQSPYVFSWNSGQTTEDLTGVTAGNYTVTMTDQMGCLISQTFTVNNAPQINITSIAVTNEECNTDNGAININVTGGSGSYGYQWSNGATTQDLTGLTAGVYTVDIVDGNGCTASQTYTITNDVSNCSAFCFIALEENSITDETCGNGAGVIDINVLNAVAPVSFSWSNGATTEDLSGLSAGTYTVVATDANNCSETATFTVGNAVGNLAISNSVINEENCGGLDGGVAITVSGGAMPYTFNWSNNATTEDISGVAAGTYTVNVTDANGCQFSQSFVVPNNSGNVAVTAVIGEEYCSNGNGSINQTVTGGNGTITYLWNTGATSQDLSSLAAGTYSCTITDQTGCSVTENYTVGQNAGSISLMGSNITNELCGNSNGAVNITVSGNSLTYLWSNGATTEDLIGVPAGNYFCTITGSQGCSLTTPTYTIINGSGSLSVNAQLITDEICGNANGSIGINVTGGTAPYSFSWSNGATDEDLLGLSAGIYTVTVTDVNGCTESRSYTVVNNSGTLDIQNAIITNEVCANAAGAIDLVVVGGTAPLSYAWSNGATSQDLTGLITGQYTVTVTDQNGCSVTETYAVTNQAAGLTATSAVTNELCSNGQGEITLSVTGGTGPYSYAWSNGGTTATISGLSAGTYNCTVSDNNGCSIVVSNIVVGNTSSGLSSSTVVTDAICTANGSIDLTVNGGTAPIDILWSTGATTEDLTNVVAGVYTYTITDNNNCVLNGSATVGQSSGTLAATFTSSGEVCNNGMGAIDLTVSGGTGPMNYLWSNAATSEDLTNLSAGTYSCTITDANGCSVTTPAITISNTSGTLTISNAIPTNETCSNGAGSIDITVSGGTAPITYLWSNGETTEDVSSLSSGVYTVTVTDANGCQASTQEVINSSAGSLAITQPIVTNENCANGQGAINISISGGANPILYQWSNGATTQDLTGLSAGSYTVTVTDNNGCSTNGTYSVLDNGSGLMVGNATVTDEFCGSGTGSIAISVSGGTAPYNYTWSNGGATNTINNLSAGTYTVVVTGAGGCQTQASYTVLNNSGTLAVSGLVTDETCGDGSGAIDVTPSGGNLPLSYSWSTTETSQDIQNLSAGTYTVLVTDNYGCTANYSGTVVNNSGGLAIAINSIADENCGQSDGAIDVTVSGTGIVSTQWDSGQTTEDLNGIAAGVYELTVTDNLGCQVSASYTVANVTGSLNVSFVNVGNENCSNGQGFVDLEVSGTAPFTYLWSDGQTTQDAIALSSGPISVVITDGNGCQLTESYTITNVNTTNLSSSQVVTDAFCSAANGAVDITLTGGIAPYSVLWSSGQTTEDITNVTAGTYSYTITDAANCQVTETISIGAQNSGLGFTNLNIQDEFCGQGDGSITIFTGGTADSYYLDGTNLGGPNATNLTAGTYTVSIEDNFGCAADTIVTVGSQAFFNVTHTQVNESCSAGDGSIDLMVNGGGGGLTFQWSHGPTTEDVSGLSAGTYTVTVTTGGGFPCSVDYTVTIVNNTTFEISDLVTDEYCGNQDGAIDLTVVAGTGLQFAWSHGPTTEDVSGLAAGVYTCTITDPAPGGCVETFDFTVGSQSNGTVINAAVTNETCGQQNGAIDLTLTGGSGNFTYAWNTTATTEDLVGLTAGTYDVVVIDQNDGCEMSANYTLINVDDVFNGSGVVTDATCATCTDGAIDISLNQGLNSTYNWSNGPTTEDVTGLLPGTYSVTITSAAGCDTTMTFEVLNTADLVDLNLGYDLSIFPNPATSSFSVNVTLPEGTEGVVTITNVLGQEIMSNHVTGSEIWEVNSENFATGVYLVNVRTTSKNILKRVVVNRK